MFASLDTTTEAPVKPLVIALSRAIGHALSTSMANSLAGTAPEAPGELFGSAVSEARCRSDAHNHACRISGNVALKHEVVAGFTRRHRR